MPAISECLRLDKEIDGGRWVVTCSFPNEPTLLRLTITVGGPWDWFSFEAEIHPRGSAPTVVGRFDISPMEIIPQNSDRYESRVIERWDPSEEPDFLKIPEEYQPFFVLMVQRWGQIAGVVVPAPAWLTIH